MNSYLTGFFRLGTAISILWLIYVACLAAIEWFADPPTAGYFVEVVIQKTGETVSSLKGNSFSDLVPTESRLKWEIFWLALLIPLAILWLV